jgi:two-component system, OmpR family, sensor histidine kinase BaeS
MRPPPLRRSLGGKLLAAQLLVILAGSATLVAVALVLGPTIFHHHVREALGVVPDSVMRHLDTAFGDALLISLAVAVGASGATAAAISWLLATRIVRPIRTLAAASRRVAQGSYGERVSVAGDDELGALAAAFNEMAEALETTERRRHQLLSDVAHELRTPVATLHGYVEGLRDGVVEPSGATWRLLHAETMRLGRLVEDLRKVSRAEERQLDLRPARSDPQLLLREAAAAAAAAYGDKGIELQVEDGDQLPPVEVDRDRIAEVLANLLSNALRHTPAGGGVTLAAARAGEDSVELSVADSGEGIPAETLGRVFERFYRADSARSRDAGGSGIGLTIARAIVEAHGGTLRAESDGVGRGARFVVTLPIA